MIEKAIGDLREINRDVPVVVEGEKDKTALRKLGLEGTIIVIQRGKRISALCDFIAENYKETISSANKAMVKDQAFCPAFLLYS